MDFNRSRELKIITNSNFQNFIIGSNASLGTHFEPALDAQVSCQVVRTCTLSTHKGEAARLF